VTCRVVVGSGKKARMAVRLRRLGHRGVVARAGRDIQREAVVTLRPDRRLRSGRYVVSVVVGSRSVATVVLRV
jgi:hypothetical protein